MGDTVRFFVNGVYHEARAPAPTTTILEYLRDTLRLCGTKEGCAEGDCGACTAVIAELHGGGYRLRSVNACIQFLPTLDGKELITVEGLRAADGALHPVQRAMVDCHASQCGFCTPGFVMALFALYKSDPAPDRRAIDYALTGNLCRCTGYRPIIDAARRMYAYGREDGGTAGDWKRAPAAAGDELMEGEREMIARLRGIRRQHTLSIDHGQRYFAPLTVGELAALIARHPDATVLAGGTDVGLWVTKQYRDLPVIIYLGDVAELADVAQGDDGITIGAAVNLSDAFAALLPAHPGLAEIYRRYASPPICHAGTLVGNIANGSPIGDSMPALMCLGAELLLRRESRTRRMKLDQFYLGYQQTALEPGEFVQAVRVPHPDAAASFFSYKISKRFDQDISAVCGAYSVTLDDDRVRDIAICYGGMAATPKRAAHTEQALLGERWCDESVRRALPELARDFTPISDMRASAAYRERVAGNLLLKFYQHTRGGGQRVFDARSEA